MWRASSIPLLFSLLVVTAPSLAWADYRAALDYAEARVQDAAAAVDAAQWALDDARARRDAAATELRQTIDSIPDLEQSLTDAQRRLEDLDRALAALERELPARQAARDEAARRAQASAAVVRQIHDEAWVPFSQSPEFIETERAVARETARVDASVERAHQRLADNPRYRQLEDDARAAEQHLEALRDDPRADPNERAAASQRWLDAKAAAQRYREEAVETDPAVQDARAALDEATRRHRAMLDAFAASLEADPRMRESRDELRAAEASLASADRALREAVFARDAAARDLQDLEGERVGREAQLAQAHARVDEQARAIESLDHDVHRSARDLSLAADALAHAVHERDAADSAYRHARVRFSHEFDHDRRYEHRDHDHDRDRDRRHHDKDEDRGKRYERRDAHGDEPRPKPEPDRPRDDRRDPPVPQLIDEQERERMAREQAQQQEDQRRALRERREAEWRQRREENRRRQEEVEKSKQQDPPPPAKPAGKREPPRPREIVIGAPPAPKVGLRQAPKVGPEPPRREEKKREATEEPRQREAKKDEPRREEAKREAPKREEPRKAERKEDSSNDRGDRYRKGK